MSRLADIQGLLRLRVQLAKLHMKSRVLDLTIRYHEWRVQRLKRLKLRRESQQFQDGDGE